MKIIDHRKGSVRVLDTKKTKTDSQIKSYLNGEYQKQINDIQNGTKTSVFYSDVLTSPGNIEQSILGFTSELDKQEYLDQQYPAEGDDGLKLPVPSPLSVGDLYKYDYMTESFNRGGSGLKGLLYCRTPSKYDAHSGRSNPKITECIKPWYRATDLDYEVIFSGI